MTILDLIQKTTAYLEKAGVPQARLDVELLLAHVLGLRRMDLYLQFERVLNESELEPLRSLVKRRAAREPLQHLLGTVDFFGIELKVSPQALIPRPETEVLAQTAIEKLGKENQGRVLDVGTGTGALILAIGAACPKVALVATDISAEALALARANAEHSGLTARVEFRMGNLLEPLQADERFALIVSNPPYIASGELPRLQPEVQHDPKLALDGGPEGLDLIRPLLSGAGAFLETGGWLLLEIGHDQSTRVLEEMIRLGWAHPTCVPDLNGIPRFAVAQKA